MMSPSTSVSEATQEQQTFEEAFIAVYVAAPDAEREVTEMEATAARVAVSKGMKRVHWIEEAQSHDEQRATKIRSRKSTGDTTEDLFRESTYEGAQEVMAEHAASGAVIEPSKPFTTNGERIPEKIQRPSLDQRTLKGRVSRPSEEQIDALVDEALACLED